MLVQNFTLPSEIRKKRTKQKETNVEEEIKKKRDKELLA
jgi:hypothetical protein